MVTRTKKPVICIDCIAEGVSTFRPTPHGGPRSPLCVTHNRARKKKTSGRAHELRLQKNFEITADEYKALYDAQDGKCFICQKATGKTKRLAVEHEHGMDGCEHPSENGCAQCIRALCCGRCNELVAFLDEFALARAIILLTDPPARKILHALRFQDDVNIQEGDPMPDEPVTVDGRNTDGDMVLLGYMPQRFSSGEPDPNDFGPAMHHGVQGSAESPVFVGGNPYIPTQFD